MPTAPQSVLHPGTRGSRLHVSAHLRDDPLSPRRQPEAGAGLARTSLADVHAGGLHAPALGRSARRRPARVWQRGATSPTETGRNGDSLEGAETRITPRPGSPQLAIQSFS